VSQSRTAKQCRKLQNAPTATFFGFAAGEMPPVQGGKEKRCTDFAARRTSCHRHRGTLFLSASRPPISRRETVGDGAFDVPFLVNPTGGRLPPLRFRFHRRRNAVCKDGKKKR